jgi:thioredoxin reductase (NADPH)
MTRSENPYDVLVIGGGLAGLTAARLAAEHGLSVAALDEGGHMGGLVMNIGRIDGFPAADGASGVELAAGALEALVEHGVEIIPESATGLALDGDSKTVITESGRHVARTLVLASGARLRSLGVPGEAALFGRGVSQCADCDAGFFTGQHVVVVGGGDSALQEALHLADYAGTITVVTRDDALRAKEDYVAQATANPKFAFRFSTTVEEIRGSDSVEGVGLRPAGGGSIEDFPCDGVFVFVGLEPNSEFLPDAIARDAQGYVVTDTACRTNVSGIYAVGAVRAGYSGQLADAVEEAAAAIANISAA